MKNIAWALFEGPKIVTVLVMWVYTLIVWAGLSQIIPNAEHQENVVEWYFVLPSVMGLLFGAAAAVSRD